MPPLPLDGARSDGSLGLTARTLLTRLLSHDRDNSVRPLDSLSIAVLAYLALPNFIFFIGWLRWPFAFFFSLLLACSVGTAIDWRQVVWRWPYRSSVGLTLVTAALVWCAFGGAGHFVAAAIDWQARDAVLGDLTYGDWPVSYAFREGVHYILRSAIGYFLPAALLAKALGIQVVDLALYLWTALGTTLFLHSLPLPQRLGLRLLLLLLLVVLFSGMDLLGALTYWGEWPEFPVRLEWWTRFSYPSLSGQLFWAPNHALPIWLGAALFYRHWQNPAFLPFALLLGALLLLWTPFALLGLTPFFLLSVLQYGVSRNQRISLTPLMTTILVMAWMGRFLTLNIDDIPATSSLQQAGAAKGFLSSYLVFILLEFGALSLLLASRLRHSHGILWISMATLSLLPLGVFGPSNDLLLRVSTPSLIMLLILTLTLFQPGNSPPADGSRPWLIVAMLSIGAFTPFHEFGRAVIVRRWPPNYERTLVDQQHGSFPPHYIGRLDRADVRLLLRDPAIVPSSTQRRAGHH
ncbi:MAG: hypothetical protein J5X22_15435 [Candidatus Accumulibacter sp.]|uniref:Uncharacterized protein n=1 Tax=Candidatus Accumulibacter cognatus TaxID=2954383 RepID=A0A7D5NAR3_9PROT|nr:hypothetical protein [Accumulibacter sp.]MBN8517254.1 hypothetical protein [Accumulibacter sp.]MBO3711830.1 hypothetical protein [Accumulibacter sp.]MCC2869965.1 hypothetical protein [Candidatus Accumulibacter phosphatis]QLH49213.1 MAG: hypothetical protein HWD57_05015 [Candidatus Accumulibacter cognatus]